MLNMFLFRLDYLQVEAYFSAGDVVWGSIAAALTGLCAIIFLGIASHFFIREGFSSKSFKHFFVDGKRKELLSWIALFIENYPMVKLLRFELEMIILDMLASLYYTVVS